MNCLLFLNIPAHSISDGTCEVYENLREVGLNVVEVSDPNKGQSFHFVNSGRGLGQVKIEWPTK